jgi:hypothetical protein
MNSRAAQIEFYSYMRKLAAFPFAAKKKVHELLQQYCYLKYGRTSPQINALFNELMYGLPYLSKFNPYHDELGRFTSGPGGNGEEDNSTEDPDNEPLDQSTRKRAQAIYGETSGLIPELLNPGTNPYNPSNWDSDSASQLEKARTYIGIVSERNPSVNFASPSDATNPIQMRAWNLSVEAATNAADGSLLDSRVTNFFLRQDGIGIQTPPWHGLHMIMSLGPFNNVGGGDVPKGANTYIDFYGK